MSRFDSGGERLTRSTKVLARRVMDDELLLLTVDGAEVVRLGGTALHLWSEMSVPRSVPEVVERLASVFRTEPEVIEEDVAESIEVLRAAGLVGVDCQP